MSTLHGFSGALELKPGLTLYSGCFDRSAQGDLRDTLRQIVQQAPLFQPTMPRTGKPLSVKMSNCGPLGWVADKRGYRYQPDHPDTGKPWPAMPDVLLALWEELAGLAGFHAPPEACLINHYAPDTRMGLHQDRDEEDFAAPVVSVSLGDEALFRFGGLERRDPTRSVRLKSGDVLVMAGPSRLIHHGVDRIYPGTSTLLREPGRINLTLRRVTPSA